MHSDSADRELRIKVERLCKQLDRHLLHNVPLNEWLDAAVPAIEQAAPGLTDLQELVLDMKIDRDSVERHRAILHADLRRIRWLGPARIGRHAGVINDCLGAILASFTVVAKQGGGDSILGDPSPLGVPMPKHAPLEHDLHRLMDDCITLEQG